LKTLNYFITGLPRSGTAWLANALTWGNSFCHHEGVVGCKDMKEYSAKLARTDAEYIGDSDTALALVLPWLYARFPDARYVFVRRNAEDVNRSLVKAGLSTQNTKEAKRAIESWISIADCMVIEFEDLFDNVHEVWDYIGLPDFPKERFEMLKHMKVDDSQRFVNSPAYDVSNFMRGAI